MKEIAFIHASMFDDHCGAPMLGGEPEDISLLLAVSLQSLLVSNPDSWEGAYEDLADVFRHHEPTRQTIWRWVRNVGRCVLYALAAVGMFALGYWLRVRAGV